MELALPSTSSTAKIRDARNGKTEFALNVQQDGTSMPTKSANPLMTSAESGVIMELALNVTMVMLSELAHALEILTPSSLLLMIYAQNGKTEFV